jgi:hypothetical protein
MPNLGDLKALIASDLRRSNLADEIANAIPDAIRDHESERFWWNETFPRPYTLTVSPNGGAGGSGVPIDATAQGDVYFLTPQNPVQEFIRIDNVRANIGGAGPTAGGPGGPPAGAVFQFGLFQPDVFQTAAPLPPIPATAATPGIWYTVAENNWDEIEFFYSTPSNGEPMRWAYRNGYLRIYPLPSQSYALRLFGHFRAMPLIADSDSNVWTNQGRNLIRYTVLKRLYSYPIRDAQQVANAEQAGERALDYLRRETDRRVRQGQMRAYYG